MTNTMVMSVFERTQEIGVLRALGWSRLRVVGMVLRESIALSLLGGAVGVATGVGMIGVINALPFFEGLAQATFSLGLFAQALFTALVLGALGGIYPAWRASHLEPVEALRGGGAAAVRHSGAPGVAAVVGGRREMNTR